MRRGNVAANLWFGALHAELRGTQVEQVITQLHRQGVVLRQLRMGQQRATVVFSLRDFDDVYRSCRGNGVKIRFLERIGAPFWMKRLLRRKSMLIGPALFVFIIYLFSSMVWQINISGVSDETAMTLRQAASDSGLYVGAWKWSIRDAQAVQDKLLSKMPDLIWVGVNYEGSRANIEAIEKIKGIDKQASTPHNIVAAKPAVITHVFATRGQVLVQPGQVVHAGEVIISGQLGDGTVNVPAAGKVMAEVWYTTDVTIPLKVAQSGLTGFHYQQGYLMLGGFGLHVWGWKNPHYQTQVSRDAETKWRIGKYELPIQWRTITNYQVQKIALEKSERTAKAEALRLANQDVQSKIGANGQILTQTVLHEEVSHGKLYEKVWTKAEEDIGVAKAFSPPAEDPKSDSSVHG